MKKIKERLPFIIGISAIVFAVVLLALGIWGVIAGLPAGGGAIFVNVAVTLYYLAIAAIVFSIALCVTAVLYLMATRRNDNAMGLLITLIVMLSVAFIATLVVAILGAVWMLAIMAVAAVILALCAMQIFFLKAGYATTANK